MDNRNFLRLLEEHFMIHEDKAYVELETHTEGGVNMFITLDKDEEESYLEQFKKYVLEFDVDEQIDIHREGHDYKKDFTVQESLTDFEEYKAELENILAKVVPSTPTTKKKAFIILSYENEIDLNTFLSKNGTRLEVSAIYEDLDAADVEHIEEIINEQILSEES